MLLKQLVEVPSFAKLSDDVTVIDAEVYVFTFDDVGMTNFTQDGHLTFK